MIDKDEYPQTAELEMRCVHMLAELWHSPDPENTIGTSTIGSSEACMLGGLALKWRWREKMRGLGKPMDRPNLVMGTNTQVCWHKFAVIGTSKSAMCRWKATGCDGSRARRRGMRREYHRGGRRSGQHLHRRLRERGGAERRARPTAGTDRPRHSRFTSMERAAASWRRFCSRIWCGTFGCRG